MRWLCRPPTKTRALTFASCQALAAWFYARKDDLKEALGAPAITVFGRQFDFRSMLKSSPVRRVALMSFFVACAPG